MCMCHFRNFQGAATTPTSGTDNCILMEDMSGFEWINADCATMKKYVCQWKLPHPLGHVYGKWPTLECKWLVPDPLKMYEVSG